MSGIGVIGLSGIISNGSATIAAGATFANVSTGLSDVLFEPVISASGNQNTNVYIDTLTFDGTQWKFKVRRSETNPDEALTVYWKVIALRPARKLS